MNRLLTLFVSFLLLPIAVFAQDSTVKGKATPFRKGQWAAQFQAGTAFGSLGFIKFRSPTRALVLDLRIDGSHSEALRSDSSGVNQFIGLHSNASVQVRFGWRRYNGDGTGAKIVSNYSLGALAGFDHDVVRGQNFSEQSNGWTVGAFGDVGGTYLLTSRFGIGALATASLSYENKLGKTSLGTKYRNWAIGGSALTASLVATVYF
ncbi:MAG TPA: hypothetical protein VF919_12820 [Gemmatimonadales bacterium]